MVTVGLYEVTKTLPRYRQSRWLRRDAVERLTGRRRPREFLSVLSGIDFEAEQGEAVAVFGVNGSGKSTLLRLVAGIMKPTSGRVVTRGSVCALLDLGTGFAEEMTGRENAMLNGAILGLTEQHVERMLPEIEDFAELSGFMDTPIKYYSAGMRARLGFAVAMSASPDVFLVDEVLAVGDEGFRRKCLARIRELVSGGTTMIIVTHDTYTPREICTRAVWLDGGRICMDGPVGEVANAYMESFDERVGNNLHA
ncbi:MAG: ABC transporter ATP-binding protein [Armatimonadota bacterium]